MKSGLLIPEFNIVVPKILPGGHNLNQMLQYRAPRRRFVPLASQQYSDRVLNTQNASLIGYWRLQEGSGSNADNYEGTAARDGTYTGATLGQTGIGDGLTAPTFDGVNDFVDCYSSSLNTPFDGDEGSIMCWGLIASSVWTDGSDRELYQFGAGGNDFIFVRKQATSNQLRFLHFSTGGGASDVVVAFSETTYFQNTPLSAAEILDLGTV